MRKNGFDNTIINTDVNIKFMMTIIIVIALPSIRV